MTFTEGLGTPSPPNRGASTHVAQSCQKQVPDLSFEAALGARGDPEDAPCQGLGSALAGPA